MATAQPKPGTASGLEPMPLDQPRREANWCGREEFGSCLMPQPDQNAMATGSGGLALLWLRPDRTGAQTVFKDKERIMTGLILQDDRMLVLRKEGLIYRRPVGYGSSLKKWHVDTGEMVHGAAMGHQLLVCLDGKTGEVFTVSLQPDGTIHKRVKLQGLNIENGRVACTGIDDGVRIAIVEPKLHRVEVYDAKWKLLTTIGGQGGGFDPRDCTFLPWGNLLVADTNNHRVSEYRLDARDGGQNQLVRHWFNSSHNVYKPTVLSFLSPHLWLLHTMKNETEGMDNELNCASRFIIFK